MNINALDSALEVFAHEGKEVSITLSDNSTVAGKIKSFDAYVILLADSPGTMVYRHSILKLAEKPVAQQKPRPAEKPVQQRTPDKKRPARVSAGPVQLKEAASDRPLSPMGEAMLKWLKSQQGK